MNLQAHSTPVRCFNSFIPQFCITAEQYEKAARIADVAEGAKTPLEQALEYAAWRKALAELGAPSMVRDSFGTVTFVTPRKDGADA